jgi:putative endonuclease
VDAAVERGRKQRGRLGETAAVALLRARGVRILARNVRVRGGCEVDVVGRRGTTLVLVEVKARRGGGSAEAVVASRQRALRRAAEQLLADPQHAWAGRVRFDVVGWDGLRPQHLRDAF